MDDNPFVVGVAVLALAFGVIWIWYHFGASPRERAERRLAKLERKAGALRRIPKRYGE